MWSYQVSSTAQPKHKFRYSDFEFNDWDNLDLWFFCKLG